MKISMIVAMTKDRVIGAKNTLPWYLPEDLKKFRELTTGHPILMGRRTFESLPRVLPNRDHYIITRNAEYKSANAAALGSDRVFVAGTPEEAMATVKASLLRDPDPAASDEVFVIGGGEIFRQMLPSADRLYITLVKEDIPGDTYFPAIEPAQWVETDRKVFDKFDFVVYDRVKG
jgi:dihydrofolate reductase